MKAFSLEAIVKALGGELSGPSDLIVHRLASLESADSSALSFFSNPKYRAQLAQSKAAAVIVSPAFKELALTRGAVIVTADPYVYFARLTQWWRKQSQVQQAAQVHPTAVIDPSAQLGLGVTVGPFVVIEAGVSIGDHSSIGAHSVIEADVRIGGACHLSPRVTVGTRCVIGDRAILHSGVVIGADGFGFANEQGEWLKIEQLGAVRIGDDVELGANTCIDRGALEDTVLEEGVKLDNLIQVGHNVHIGKHTAMAGCVGIAGSSRIGAYCTVGGGAIILGHLQLVDRVHVSAATVVTRSIKQPGHYSGLFPFEENTRWEKNAAVLKQLHPMRQRLRELEASLKRQESDPLA